MSPNELQINIAERMEMWGISEGDVPFSGPELADFGAMNPASRSVEPLSL